MLESLFNKFAGLQAGNYITKRLQHGCFPVNIAKFLKISNWKDIKIEKTGTYSLTIIRNVFRTQWNIKDEGFPKNSCLYLTVDYFCKTIHIICFRGLWICLDKTKQNLSVLSFISQKVRTAISANLFLNSILSSRYYLAVRL